MAKLPPKLPAIPPTWPSFSQHNHPRPPPMSSFLPSSPNPSPETASRPSWADDFFDFSSAKRGAHRRTLSDSITFYEPPLAAPEAGAPPASSDFDRLDDEQLMAMFSGDPPPPASALPSTAPSTPSDHNSISDQDKQTPLSWGSDQSEAQSECNAEQPNSGPGMEAAPSLAPETSQSISDPKRVKRILANRQSAQRSRVRKLQYISELERSVAALQTEVSTLSPRVAFLDHQRSVLSIGNSHLKQRIAALAQDKIFKDAHQEALQNEIERLRHVYSQQNLKKMAAAAAGGCSGGGAAAADEGLSIPTRTDHDPSSES